MMSEQDTFSVPSNIITTVGTFDPNPNPNILLPNPNNTNNPNPAVKRKRSLPGTPDPEAEVIALSPKSLMATNRFICEICNKGFQRDQNLQLHRRGHNLPWKLKQRAKEEVVRKKVYVCPEKSCVHNHPSRALGDLTGIKKHFSRKHGEKKWKCDKCSKKYAVQSDWKAHTKICGTREYRCDCGTLFSRKDSFITHRAFCEALAEQSVRMMSSSVPSVLSNLRSDHHHHLINNATQAPRISQTLLGFQHEFGGGSVAEPLMGNHLSHSHSDHIIGHKFKLPLWLDQANSSHHHPLNTIIPITTNNNDDNNNNTNNNSSGLLFGPSSSSQAPWPMNYGYASEVALSSSSFASENENPSMAVGVVMKREEQEENKIGEDDELLSHSVMSSLYSSSSCCQNPQGGPSHHMSATALLQKATQMESTRINDHDHDSATFGFLMPSNNHHGNILDIHKIFKQAPSSVENNNNNNDSLNEMVNSSSFVNEGWQNNNNSNNNNNNRNDEEQLGLTRDFLGVGGDDDESSLTRAPFLHQQQLTAKFDSMRSVMNLQSQFGGRHHH